MSTDTQDTEKPSRNFLKRLYDELKASGDLTLDSFQTAVRKARAHAGGKAKAEKSKAMAESLTDLIDKVQTALYNWFRSDWTGQSAFSYAREVFSNYVIACSNTDGKDYKIPYSIVNDEVEFGEPEEVEIVYVPAGTDVVGMHEVADLCADGRALKLFNEFHFADPPEWFNFLPKPGKYTSPVYGDIVITEERNQNFIDNFKKKVYQEKLPIDCEHDIAASGAVGWIVDLKLNDEGGVDARSDWTDRGKELIEADRFKYFSPSWFSIWTDPVDPDTQINDVAIGGALTTRPFFKEKALRPLVANEKGISILDGDLKNLNGESVVVLNFTALAPVDNSKGVETMAENKSGAETEQGLFAKFKEWLANEKPTDPAKPEPKKAAEPEAVTPQAFSELQTKLTASEAKNTTLESNLTKANERIDSLEKAARAKRFSETAKEFLGEPAKHIAMMEHLATADEKGEESELFKEYVAQQSAIAAQAKTAGLFTEVGSSAPAADGAVSRVNATVAKFMESDPKLTKEQAFDKWYASAPKAEREAYREEANSIM